MYRYRCGRRKSQRTRARKCAFFRFPRSATACEALVEAARAGVGITQVPSYMADEAIKRNEVVEVLPDIRPRPNPISAIYASQRNLPASIRAFIDFLTTRPRPHYAPEPRPASSRARRAMGTAQR